MSVAVYKVVIKKSTILNPYRTKTTFVLITATIEFYVPKISK